MSPTVLSALVTAALVVLMASVGLKLDWAGLAELRRRPLYLSAVAAVNFLAVPALTVALLAIVQPNSAVAVGFIVTSLCPGAPYGPPLATAAKGDPSAAVGLMVLLAASSAVVAPLLLPVFLPFAMPDAPPVDGLAIALRLVVSQLLPLALGALCRLAIPKVAARLERPVAALSAVLNLAAIGLILAYFLPELLKIRPLGFAGITLLVLGSAALGRLCGGADRAFGRSALVTTAIKNVAVALVISASVLPGGGAVVAAVAYGVLGLIMTAIVVKLTNR